MVPPVPGSPDRTDQQLVAMAQAGEGAAWEELARRHHAPLLKYLRARTGDPEAAADLAQETFVDAYRGLAALPADRPFAPWLYRIAWNNCLPFWRNRSRRAHASLEALPEHVGEDHPALRMRVEVAAETAERDAIQRVLDDLTPALREALLLHTAAGFKAREVAAILAISPRAAEQRVTRAHLEFRSRYSALDRR